MALCQPKPCKGSSMALPFGVSTKARPSIAGNDTSSHELLCARPNTKRFAVVLTHLPSLPTSFSECFSFISFFSFHNSHISSIHSLSPSQPLLPFSPFISCLPPVPSPFFPLLQVPLQALANVTAQQSNRIGKPRHQGNLTASA